MRWFSQRRHANRRRQLRKRQMRARSRAQAGEPMRARAAATKNGRRRSPERVIAVFSDIHSNLEALQAVLEDMEAHGVTERFCLGDIVGYNADPALCLDVVRRLDCPVIQGNHDREGAEDEPLFGYRELARISMQHTRDRLSDEQKRWLRGLPLILEDPDFTLVHGSLFEPKEFFYVDSILEAEFHFANQQKQLCFCGHTHIARVFAQADIAEDLFLEEEAELRLEDGLKYLVNVGSVGQPRDRDWRASYVLYYPDSRRILYRRVQYDVGKAQQKINAAGLPAALGERILVGV